MTSYIIYSNLLYFWKLLYATVYFLTVFWRYFPYSHKSLFYFSQNHHFWQLYTHRRWLILAKEPCSSTGVQRTDFRCAHKLKSFQTRLSLGQRRFSVEDTREERLKKDQQGKIIYISYLLSDPRLLFTRTGHFKTVNRTRCLTFNGNISLPKSV